jgi:hypothetical protein
LPRYARSRRAARRRAIFTLTARKRRRSSGVRALMMLLFFFCALTTTFAAASDPVERFPTARTGYTISCFLVRRATFCFCYFVFRLFVDANRARSERSILSLKRAAFLRGSITFVRFVLLSLRFFVFVASARDI